MTPVVVVLVIQRNERIINLFIIPNKAEFARVLKKLLTFGTKCAILIV